ncbi:MAG TPA: DUF4395 family protein [Candidatus Polarisedimenticolaceae bacterium]|nr:DUF4395 family protein [Candidatus Polarisedimenticolaceae bacterium]
MTSDSARNFVAQQGVDIADPASCEIVTSALLFQPRVVAVWALLGAVLRSGWAFVALGVVLWWCALVPAANPFEWVYNRFGVRHRLGPAPPPRRFSQGMAGTFALAIGAAMLLGWTWAAVAIGVLFAVALTALVVGRLCLGSFVYHLIRGNVGFAMRTLPWGRGV